MPTSTSRVSELGRWLTKVRRHFGTRLLARAGNDRVLMVASSRTSLPSLIPQLKPREAIQLLLDPALQVLAAIAFGRPALADPIPLLHQKLPVLPVGLDIQRGDDLLADQDRQGEIAEL